MVDRVKTHPWQKAAVGDEIDSVCPRCEEETIHRIVAMVEDRVHLVICTRCGGQHRYRPTLVAMRRMVRLPSERQARVVQKITAARAPQTQEPLEEWGIVKNLLQEEDPLPYDQSLSYREKQVIDHPAFGLGYVLRVIANSKIEVVFQYQVKILVMNRPQKP